MKEIKTFFTRGNRLNKGYARVHSLKEPDTNSFYRKRFEHVLPPVDIMTEYEDMYPGTLERLINMAEKEQTHRHKLDLAMAEKQYISTRRGQVFSLIVMGFISIVVISLAIIDVDNGWSAIIFSAISFSLIGLLSLIGNKNSNK